MKKIGLCFILFISIFCFCGCEEEYPENAFVVGKGQEYETIQSAIDASVVSGQYILVKSGTYNENLNLNKPVRIVGQTNAVKISGSAVISESGVCLKKLAFDGGKLEGKQNGIIVKQDKEIDGLVFDDISIKNYSNYGLVSLGEPTVKNQLKNVTIKNSRFIGNKKKGIIADNMTAAYLNYCYFEKNGSEAEDSAGCAIDLSFVGGDYCGISIGECDFKFNGNENVGSGAIALKSRGGIGDEGYDAGNYDGSVSINDCLFMGNSGDIVVGIENIPSSKVETTVINSRSYKPKIENLAV